MIRLILAETDTEVDIAKLDSVSGNSAFHLASASASVANLINILRL